MGTYFKFKEFLVNNTLFTVGGVRLDTLHLLLGAALGVYILAKGDV